MDTNDLVGILKASEILGVSRDTLRRWEREEKIEPFTKTTGGHRRYSIKQLKQILGENSTGEDGVTRVYIYCRVSTQKQKKDGNLMRQKNRLLEYCVGKGYKVEAIFEEVASGINEKRRELHKMLSNLKGVNKIVVEYPDRLARFGFLYLEHLTKNSNVQIEVMEANQEKDTNEEMVEDLISIITSFSARIYGARGGRKVKKTLDQLAQEGDAFENNS